MIHSFTNKKNRNYRYYVCQTAHKQGKQACPTKNIAAAEIEKFVFERIKEIGKSPDLINASITKVHKEFQKKHELLSIQVGRLRKEIDGMDAETARLKEKLPNAEDEKKNEIKKRIAEIDIAVSEKRKMLVERNADLDEVEKKSVCEKDVKEALAVFDPVWDALHPHEQTRVASLLMEKVVYDPSNSEISITFNPLGMKNLLLELKEKV